ncbi:MAG: hypothetical protein WC495_04445 [Patescibacteria group bacterium]|jgi:hypothetical protein
MFSRLQRYIIRELLSPRPVVADVFVKYYSRFQRAPKKQDQKTSITRSLERLIEQGMIVAQGIKTKEKFFIEKVRLTPQGRKHAKKLFAQPQLPFIIKRSYNGHSKKS